MGISAAFAIFEIGLRIAGITKPYFYTYDEVRGWALRPGVKGWQTDEGKAFIRINSDGFRDREHVGRKPAGTLRIAVLGDSFSDAYQVPLEETFWAVMEREAGKCETPADIHVEVLNFGVRGYSTAQELLTLREKVWDYDPDIVLLAFYTENDIVENSPELNSKSDIAPFFVYRNGRLELDNSFNSSTVLGLKRSFLYKFYLNGLRDHSRVLQMIDIDRVYRAIRDWTRIKRKKDANVPDDPLGEIVVFRECYVEPPEGSALEEAWKITEGLILLMRDEVKSKSAEFIVVTLSNPIQDYPSLSLREKFENSLSVKNLFYADFRIEKLGEREGFPVLNLSPALQRYADRNQEFLHGFDNIKPGCGHWNARGHKIAGETLAAWLCEIISGHIRNSGIRYPANPSAVGRTD